MMLCPSQVRQEIAGWHAKVQALRATEDKVMRDLEQHSALRDKTAGEERHLLETRTQKMDEVGQENRNPDRIA
jgi:hypothetical protein